MMSHTIRGGKCEVRYCIRVSATANIIYGELRHHEKRLYIEYDSVFIAVADSITKTSKITYAPPPAHGIN